MALHVLHNPERFATCQAILDRHDALLLMDEAAQMLASSSLLKALPCPVFLLQSDSATSEPVAAGITLITIDEWVSLTLAHRHALDWT